MKKHEHIYSIDYYAYLSEIREWNSEFKVMFSVLTILFCIWADNVYVSLGIFLIMGYITMGKGKIHFHDYISLMTIPLAFMILSSVAIAVDSAKEAVGVYYINCHWFYLYLTPKSLYEAFLIMMKSLSAVSAMYMMALSTPISEIISVLRKMHVPKFMLELMNLIYRYIFILMEVQSQLKNAAEGRLGYCDFITSCRTFGTIMSNILIISIKKAGMYYDSMESRCFHGEILFLENNKPVKRQQLALTVLFFTIMMLIKVVTERNEGFRL